MPVELWLFPNMVLCMLVYQLDGLTNGEVSIKTFSVPTKIMGKVAEGMG